MSYGLHWFRRDLRVAGNNALRHSFKKHDGRVICFFMFDHKFLSRDDFSTNRFQFFLNTLLELKSELRSLGGDLITFDEGPETTFKNFFDMIEKNDLEKPSEVTWSRDYEPFARKRDEKAKAFFKKKNIEVKTFRDHLIIEPHEIYRSKPGEFYQVYSPFAKKWMKVIQEKEFSKRIAEEKASFEYLKNGPKKVFDLKGLKKIIDLCPKKKLEDYSKDNQKKVTVPIPESGFKAAVDKLNAFKPEKYKDLRDIPEEEATSGMSVFLKNGSITTSQIVYHLGLKPYDEKKSSKDTYLSELVWREFYYHILYHKPEVETEEFNSKYSGLKWDNNEKFFELWKEGKTGYPIVDAGMRQLKTTGLMHNRVRMIVASFLTKHLLIDWRWGEQYFMEQLLDGDLAPNNGGWQWAASTGCDAQPYFRVFNPWLQSKKFDPDGVYIKKYVPELREIESKKLHEPITDHAEYPAPIVEHKTSRQRAIEVYKNHSSS